MPYALFASYCCEDGKRFGGVPFKKFTELLRDLIDAKVEKRRPQLCFVDTNGIKVGDSWENVLVDGVRTSEVLICLVSPRYLGSKWCGRELEVFHRRIERLQAESDQPRRFVFPVWWEKPKDRRTLPDKLRVFAFADSEYPATYEQRGLRQLADLNSGRDDLILFAEALSDRIVETLDQKHSLPEGDPIPNFDAFPSAFEILPVIAPYQVAALAAVQGGLAWSPVSGESNLSQILDRIGSRASVDVNELEVGSGVRAALAKAHDQRQLVLLIAEASTEFQTGVLADVNAVNLPNLAVLVVHAGAASTGRPTAEAWTAQFPDGSISAAFRGGRLALTGPGELDAMLEALVTRARQGLIQADPPERVTDETLIREAMENGVPTEQNPMLAPRASS